jgi:hypothetical protein
LAEVHRRRLGTIPPKSALSTPETSLTPSARGVMTPVGTDFGSVPRRGEKQPGKGKRETQHTQSEGGKAAERKGETVTWGGAECGKGGKVMINGKIMQGQGMEAAMSG